MTDTVYKYIGGSEEDGILACGYMEKTSQKSQIDFIIPYYSVFFLISGSGVYKDEYGNESLLRPGAVVQRLPGVCHSTVVEDKEPWREFFISLGRGIYEGLKSIELISPKTPVVFSSPSKELYVSFDRLLVSLREKAGFAELLKAQSIILSLLSTKLNEDELLVENAKTILSVGLEKNINCACVAQELGVGNESFRKIFKKSTGLSPMDFRVEQKILTARLMLLGGSSIKETALSLGYCDSYSFSKQFKKKTGLSPGIYKGNR